MLSKLSFVGEMISVGVCLVNVGYRSRNVLTFEGSLLIPLLGRQVIHLILLSVQLARPKWSGHLTA